MTWEDDFRKEGTGLIVDDDDDIFHIRTKYPFKAQN